MEKDPLPITIREIARQANVSNSTVSRALRNHPAISKKTGELVHAIARQLGYKRNPLVATLTSQLRMSRITPYQATLGFLTAYPTRDGWRTDRPANLRYFNGARERASFFGYEIEEFWIKEPKLTAERTSKILLTRGLRGLLVAPMPYPSGHLAIDWSLFASATIGFAMAVPHLHSARNHHYHAISLALRKLKNFKFSRIGLALMPQSHKYADELFRARYLDYLHTAVGEEVIPIFCENSRVEKFTEKDFQCWFMKYRPQAIICMGDDIHHWLANMQVAVPEEVALVDLCIHDRSRSWSGVDMREEEVAAAAVDLVVHHLHYNDPGVPRVPKSVLIEGQWIEGNTLPEETNSTHTIETFSSGRWGGSEQI